MMRLSSGAAGQAARRSALLGAAAACGAALAAPAADAERGRQLLAQYQCGTCHRIPGVEAADGRLAADLARYGSRSYISGRIPLSAAALERWVVEPQALVPATAMPSMGVSAADARHIAAYLLALR